MGEEFSIESPQRLRTFKMRARGQERLVAWEISKIYRKQKKPQLQRISCFHQRGLESWTGMDSPGFLFSNKKDRYSRTKLIPTTSEILASPAPIRHLKKLGGGFPLPSKRMGFEPNITFFSVLAQEEIPSKFYLAVAALGHPWIFHLLHARKDFHFDNDYY